MNTPEVQTRSDQKRNSITQAAIKLFLQDGFKETSMDAVADAAGVSKQTIYSHFGSKEKLFAGIMEDVCKNASADIYDSLNSTDAPEKALTTLGINKLTMLTDDEAIALFRLIIAEASRNPELGEVFMCNGPESGQQKLGTYLEAQHKQGTLHVEEPLVAAELFFGMLLGHLHLEALVGLPIPHSEEKIKKHVGNVVSTFIRAYKA